MDNFKKAFQMYDGVAIYKTKVRILTDKQLEVTDEEYESVICPAAKRGGEWKTVAMPTIIREESKDSLNKNIMLNS